MPNALLEAMACEKAAIATSVGGIPEVVMNCDHGILVPANDAGALSNAISHLFENESLRRKLGGIARQTIMATLTPQLELEEDLKIYRTLGLNS